MQYQVFIVIFIPGKMAKICLPRVNSVFGQLAKSKLSHCDTYIWNNSPCMHVDQLIHSVRKQEACTFADLFQKGALYIWFLRFISVDDSLAKILLLTFFSLGSIEVTCK